MLLALKSLEIHQENHCQLRSQKFLVMDTQKFQELSETEKDVNPVIHTIKLNCIRYLAMDLSSRPTGKKKKGKTPYKKTRKNWWKKNPIFLI